MLLIQIVAALLLLSGSILIFKALLEIDAPAAPGRQPRRVSRSTARRLRLAAGDHDLPRAA